MLIAAEKFAKHFLLQNMPEKPHKSAPLKYWKAAVYEEATAGGCWAWGRRRPDSSSRWPNTKKSVDPLT
jgi:hypothetical protein